MFIRNMVSLALIILTIIGSFFIHKLFFLLGIIPLFYMGYIYIMGIDNEFLDDDDDDDDEDDYEEYDETEDYLYHH